jgi:hypothetical protein
LNSSRQLRFALGSGSTLPLSILLSTELPTVSSFPLAGVLGSSIFPINHAPQKNPLPHPPWPAAPALLCSLLQTPFSSAVSLSPLCLAFCRCLLSWPPVKHSHTFSQYAACLLPSPPAQLSGAAKHCRDKAISNPEAGRGCGLEGLPWGSWEHRKSWLGWGCL